jgi:hypothetical protein
VGSSQTSVVASMNSSREIVASNGSPHFSRSRTDRARSNRPLLAMTTRSVRSRRTGFAGRWNDPHAHDPAAPRAFTQTTSPRGRRRNRSCKIHMTSPASERYGFRPRFATFTQIRPPGSSVRTHSANTSSSICR